MPDEWCLMTSDELFQSAPGREVGRCASPGEIVTYAAMFQSAPGREVGRCLDASSVPKADGGFQSAPGREVGRCSTFATCCFDCRTC